jgi:hypothetical protein
MQNIHNMYNMQNMQDMQTWMPVAFVLLQHRNKGTRVLFLPGIVLGFNREQPKQFAEPDIINSELTQSLATPCGWSAAISLVSSTNKKCTSDKTVLLAQSGGLYTG